MQRDRKAKPGIDAAAATIGVARALSTQGLSDLGTPLFRSVCHSFLPSAANSKTVPSHVAAKNVLPPGANRTSAPVTYRLMKKHGLLLNAIPDVGGRSSATAKW